MQKKKVITHSIDGDEWYRHFEQIFNSGASLEREEPEHQDASETFDELLDGDIRRNQASTEKFKTWEGR